MAPKNLEQYNKNRADDHHIVSYKHVDIYRADHYIINGIKAGIYKKILILPQLFIQERQ